MLLEIYFISLKNNFKDSKMLPTHAENYFFFVKTKLYTGCPKKNRRNWKFEIWQIWKRVQRQAAEDRSRRKSLLPQIFLCVTCSSFTDRKYLTW